MKSNRFQKGLACDLGLNLLSVLLISYFCTVKRIFVKLKRIWHFQTFGNALSAGHVCIKKVFWRKLDQSARDSNPDSLLGWKHLIAPLKFPKILTIKSFKILPTFTRRYLTAKHKKGLKRVLYDNRSLTSFTPLKGRRPLHWWW